MSLDLLIPFLILIFLVIYLIYTRNKFEKKTLEDYDKKFQEWKKHNNSNDTTIEHKKLVGLVYKKGYKVQVELLEENANVANLLQKGKYSIKDR